jgi:hypothetical protein
MSISMPCDPFKNSGCSTVCRVVGVSAFGKPNVNNLGALTHDDS